MEKEFNCIKCQRINKVPEDLENYYCSFCGTANKTSEKNQETKKTTCNTCGSEILLQTKERYNGQCRKCHIENPTPSAETSQLKLGLSNFQKILLAAHLLLPLIIGLLLMNLCTEDGCLAESFIGGIWGGCLVSVGIAALILIPFTFKEKTGRSFQTKSGLNFDEYQTVRKEGVWIGWRHFFIVLIHAAFLYFLWDDVISISDNNNEPVVENHNIDKNQGYSDKKPNQKSIEETSSEDQFTEIVEENFTPLEDVTTYNDYLNSSVTTKISTGSYHPYRNLLSVDGVIYNSESSRKVGFVTGKYKSFNYPDYPLTFFSKDGSSLIAIAPEDQGNPRIDKYALTDLSLIESTPIRYNNENLSAFFTTNSQEANGLIALVYSQRKVLVMNINNNNIDRTFDLKEKLIEHLGSETHSYSDYDIVAVQISPIKTSVIFFSMAPQNNDGRNHILIRYDTKSEKITTLKEIDGCNQASFGMVTHPTKNEIACACYHSKGEVKIIDGSDLSEKRIMKFNIDTDKWEDFDVGHITISSDGRYIASVGRTKYVIINKYNSGNMFVYHELDGERANEVFFKPNSHNLVAKGYPSNKLYEWTIK